MQQTIDVRQTAGLPAAVAIALTDQGQCGHGRDPWAADRDQRGRVKSDGRPPGASEDAANFTHSIVLIGMAVSLLLPAIAVLLTPFLVGSIRQITDRMAEIADGNPMQRVHQSPAGNLGVSATVSIVSSRASPM
jgi:hypothetical protein